MAGGAVMGGLAVAPAQAQAAQAQTGQAQAATAPRNAPGSFADLAEKLLPAVVNISTSQSAPQRPQGQRPEVPQFPPGSPFEDFFRDFFDRQQQQDQPQRKATSLGSGFIIDAKNGYVVTNNHVVQDADEITVILQDDTNIKAELVGKDSKTDLALLKIKTSHPLVAVPFGDSDAMRVGDWVLAIGNPFGLGGSVTAGIISARQRNIDAGPYDDFLQTDASINRGNSGGPMFNLNGEVIGINTAIFSPSGGSVGIGFAIPSNLAKQVVAQLKDYGKTRRGWLGVRIQAVTPEIAESLGLPNHKGALVASVTQDGPAAKGGIQAGDVVTKFDGREIDEMRRLPRVVAETSIDKAVPVEVWRKGKSQTVHVKVGELEPAEKQGLL
ncbi:Do family serine endopeptidase, partial [Azospirillum sp. B506]|uniref:Do family serine endopeptidase n=1 Tax=Azospirillum sp. B506 TaxID=137721 RepID=UPI0035D3DEC6